MAAALCRGTIPALDRRAPGEFLLQQRIAHAKYLLALGDAKVMRIAEECGFASQSSFYVAFTRLAGMTPAVYRRNQTDLSAHD